ncbi:MAG: alpha/beta hydrolase [Blastocatellia bacterium]|nr:alpha/beta hydrolase [Blastocatellia bacterium]
MDKFAEVNKIQLHYIDYPGNDPTLVLLHGITANAHIFDGLIEAGLNLEFRVLAVDMRGRGLSEKPPTGYGMTEHAADVIGLLDSLGIKQAIICGHSFGGLVTLFLASHFPERVSKFALLDASGPLVNPLALELIKPSLDRLGRVVPSWKDYLEKMKQAPSFDGWWDSAIESYFHADVEIFEDGSVRPRSRIENITEAITYAGKEDWDRCIANIKQPSILIHAPEPYGPPGTPPIVPLNQALATAEALSECRYIKVPGNHITMLYGDGARETVRNIVDFVKYDS